MALFIHKVDIYIYPHVPSDRFFFLSVGQQFIIGIAVTMETKRGDTCFLSKFYLAILMTSLYNDLVVFKKIRRQA